MALRRLELSAYNFKITEFMMRPDDPDRWHLDPPYQRGEVWDITRRQNLIRSILSGIPIGAVYINRRPFDPDHPGRYATVVDGKQRITTLRAFWNSEFAVPAEWFAEETNPRTGELETFIDQTSGPIPYLDATVEGVLYSGLNHRGQGLFDRGTIGICEATVPTEAEEAALYLTVNFGGVPQTDEDRARARAVASPDQP